MRLELHEKGLQVERMEVDIIEERENATELSAQLTVEKLINLEMTKELQ